MKTKPQLIICLFLFVSFTFNSFAQTHWVQKANVDTTRRYGGIGFSLNGKGYIGLGATDGNGRDLADLEKWDPATNTWTAAADFPGGGRLDATSFVINGVAYVGLGTSSTNGTDDNNDLWKYDDATDTWTQVSSMPAGAGVRYSASSFVVGTKAYVFGGSRGGTPYLGDVWEYDAMADKWAQKSGLPSALSSVEVTATFSLGNFGYIAGAGYNDGVNNHNVYQLWQYNPDSDAWVNKGALPGSRRYSAACFVLNGIPYFGSGEDSLGNNFNDFWQMDTTKFTWSVVDTFPGKGRIRSVAFTIDTAAYVGTGSFDFINNVYNPPALNDFWGYQPTPVQSPPGQPTLSGNWVQKANVDSGSSRYGAIGFSLNGIGYIGLGATSGNAQLLADLKKWNPNTNTWMAAAGFPGGGRLDAISFVINGVAYAGLGTSSTDGSINNNDLWKYDAVADSWSQVSSMPSGAGLRYSASCFVVGTKAYIFGGSRSGTPYLGDVWEYDATTDTWIQKNNLPAELSSVEVSATFALGNFGYIAGAGYNDGITAYNVHELWQYNPLSDSWLNKGDLPGTHRFSASVFVLNGIPCFGSGEDSLGNNLTDFWQMDTAKFTWSPIDSLPAIGRIRTVAFAIGNSGYVGTGAHDFNKNVTDPPALNDFWQYTFQPHLIVSFSSIITGLQVAFNPSISGGTATAYSWSFGDGTNSTSNSPAHTYGTPGTYHVCLTVTDSSGSSATQCNDVVVSIPAHCSAYFTMYPDSLHPHLWSVLNETIGAAPITYTWQWGDGTSGTGDTATHTYASAGFYTICLTITDDTGCTSSYCDTSAYLFRMDGSNTMVGVHVVNKTIALGNPSTLPGQQNNLMVMPNPCATCAVKGIDNVNDMIATDMLGRKIEVLFSKTADAYNISFPGNQTGMFLLHNVKTGQVVKFVRE